MKNYVSRQLLPGRYTFKSQDCYHVNSCHLAEIAIT